ncbi:hypothetical protein A33O_09299 [Nitratireductor aquibiodomus RA22]|uniref:C-type lysozyme inhibitor domain-containing protein n=1 Tax=Nitratireductor aquibiodomus RA22 TaxID=1189611 RepID=I5C034_9HYPH|nr:hypothetical protein [Nitratireductor aquibiodomus]EIM75186.1 hypothetical protein A33O_09299 [Nitratireductor aquibiodomus RA22]
MTFSDSPLSRLRKRGPSGLLAVAGCAVILAGCVSTPSGEAKKTTTLAFSGPVKLACDDGMEMTVTPRSGGISVVSPRGVEIDLPASPPGQSVRYGESLYAVVIEGSEALWMVSGKVPITCRR